MSETPDNPRGPDAGDRQAALTAAIVEQSVVDVLDLVRRLAPILRAILDRIAPPPPAGPAG